MPDIFNADPAPVVDLTVDDLVGPDKKFSDVNALVKGKVQADAFIEQLKQENQALRSRADHAPQAEAQLAELRAELAALREQVAKPVVQPDNASVTPPSVKDIQSIVEETITRAEQAKTATQNITAANAEMVRHFGAADKAAEAVAQKAAELGLSMQDLKGIASRSPTAFRRIVLGDGAGERAPDVTATLSRGTVSPSAVNISDGPKPGTREFYLKTLKSNPREYMNPKTQKAILDATLKGTYVPD